MTVYLFCFFAFFFPVFFLIYIYTRYPVPLSTPVIIKNHIAFTHRCSPIASPLRVDIIIEGNRLTVVSNT